MSSFFIRLSSSEITKFVKYGLVGVMGLVVDMGVFYLMSEKLSINYAISNICSSTLAVVHNFLLNSYYTFKVTDKKRKRFISFYLISLFGMAISTGILALLIDGLKVHAMVSKLVALLFVAIIQYFLNKKLTFRKK